MGNAPWLIVTHANHGNRRKAVEKQTFCSLSEGKSYIKTIVDLDGKSIVASSRFGWLILRERDNVGMYSVWNPVTLQYLLLPKLPDAPEQRPRCVFTSAPDTEACVLVLFFEGLVCLCINPNAGGDCRWIRHRLEHDGESVSVTDAIFLNGFIYARASYKSREGGYESLFSRLKVSEDDSYSLSFEPFFLEVPHHLINFKIYVRRLDHILEVSGVVYLVHMLVRHADDMGNYDIFKAFIWRLDMSAMSWIRVESLGDRAFLLSYRGSTWCYGGVSGALVEKNTIYLVADRYHTLHSYRLRDDNCSFISPHPSFHWSGGNAPTWFIPPHCIRFVLKLPNFIFIHEEKEVSEKVNNAEMNLRLSNNLLSEIHIDIMSSIADHLHLLDYLNLCVAYQNLDPEMTWAKWQRGCSFPLFASFKNKNDLCELWDPRENIVHSFNTPHLADHLATIEFCNNGWLLLRVEGYSLQYLNPFTKERGTYPSSYMITCNASYAFSTCPTSSDCVTVAIDGYNEVIISCFEAANNEWSYHSFGYNPDEDVEFWANYNSSPKYYDGAFYFLDVKGNLGIFEKVEEEWCWDVYPSPLTEYERLTLYSCYLVELDGQLTCVYIHHLGRRVQVFKLDVWELHWDKLHDLGEHVLFLSSASSFSPFEKDITKRNRIYLSRFVGDKIVYYSLDTCMFHTLGEGDSRIDLYGTSSQPFCCWI
ncbi:hypothetical protein RND81_08G193800 [Saponaria officinalis]|uniref:KIB1-4 beta-propeller domain-containing protein n=1 Tax=Saponaria officinalis TaxID=3572 RepID=A0AAW1J9S9_SAPOF